MCNHGVMSDTVRYMLSPGHPNYQLFIISRFQFEVEMIYKLLYTLDTNI